MPACECVGIGVVSPFGTSLRSIHVDTLLQGRSGIAPITDSTRKQCRDDARGETDRIRAADVASAHEAAAHGAHGCLRCRAHELAIRGCADASRSPTAIDDSGVMLGTWTAGGQSTKDYISKRCSSGGPQVRRRCCSTAPSAMRPQAWLRSSTSCAVRTRPISHKEASGLVAIATAVEMLRLGRASASLAGGVDAIYRNVLRACDCFQVMSPARAFSTRASHRSIATRSGFVLGEGGVGLWLESADAVALARRDGAWMDSRQCGDRARPCRSSMARRHRSRWSRTMRRALDDAGYRAADVMSCTRRRMPHARSISSRPRRSAHCSRSNVRAWSPRSRARSARLARRQRRVMRRRLAVR